MDSKNSTAAVVVVLGEHRYQVEPAWSGAPGSSGLQAISKLTADAEGRVYACQRSGPAIVRLASDGSRDTGLQAPVLVDPHGMCVSLAGDIYAVDRDGHRVFILEPRGRVLRILGDRTAPRHNAPFNHPTDVAVSPAGDIFVADGYGNSMVHRFDANGALVRSWGTPGRRAGQFSTPHGICVLGDAKVAVGDRENNRVQVFGFDGEVHDIWEDVYHPMEVCVDADGMVYVSDQTPRISMFDPSGALIGRCRAPLPSVAHGMAIDPQGNIFLSGPRAAAIVRLRRMQQEP